jgi:hypothetical protein
LRRGHGGGAAAVALCCGGCMAWRWQVVAWLGVGGSGRVVAAVAWLWQQWQRPYHGSDSGHIALRWPHGMTVVATWRQQQQQLVTPRCSCEGGSNMAYPAMRRTATWHVQLRGMQRHCAAARHAVMLCSCEACSDTVQLQGARQCCAAARCMAMLCSCEVCGDAMQL